MIFVMFFIYWTRQIFSGMGKCEQCIVRQFSSLKALTKDELIRISGCKTDTVVSKGEIIFREGETINGVYCVKSGLCKVSKLSENGRDQIVKLITKGDLLGQRSLVSNTSVNFSAAALNDMEVCFIPKSEIMEDLKQNPNFSMEMLKDFANDLKQSNEFIVDMAQKSVKQRLAETLIYLHENFDVEEDGFLSVTLSREDYSNIVGTATESAIRILSQFKKQGYISTSGKRIKVENINALRRIE